MNGSIAAIVLAAGGSRRLGQPKQLLLHNGETLLARAVRLATEAGATPVIVVLGAYHQRIREAVNMDRAIPIINDQWEQGISTSIHAGLHALDELRSDAEGAMLPEGALILSCDQPRLTAEHLRGLVAALVTHAGPSIAASSYADVVGIPAVFPRVLFAELQALRGDKGARALLVEPRCPVIAVPFHGGDIDIDQPRDLAELG
ncbi:MAG: nucleotidyltransferase family protein [Terracidiphilus sp.]